jgi:hypothetical protein
MMRRERRRKRTESRNAVSERVQEGEELHLWVWKVCVCDGTGKERIG